MVNISRWRCDALILIIREVGEPPVVELVKLDELTYDDAHAQAKQYLTALTERTGRDRDHAMSATLAWLWRVVADPVLSAIGYQPVADGTMHRAWWCPTGPMGILPLHAAAHHDPQQLTGSSAVVDHVISSYTPTLLALIRSREILAGRLAKVDKVDRQDRRLLHVAVSNTPDQESLVTTHEVIHIHDKRTVSLPGVIRSRAFVEQLLPADRRTSLEGPSATRKSVEEALGRHIWVHFDCHGTQDLENPFQSGLVLHDQVLTVADLAAVRRDRAEFAFLAACMTAASDTRLPDEGINLTTALQYAGYPYVIGTLWSVHDRSAERITKSVYGRLAIDGHITPAGSARALHDAVREERARHPDHPSVWASFLHAGP